MKLALLAVLAWVVLAEAPCVLVNQSSVTAGDLAAAIPEFRAIAADRHLVWAPAPGLTRWLRAAELRAIAARESVAVATGSTVCLQRRTVVISEEQVVDALRERLPAGSEIRIVDYCRLPMMPGRLRFEVRPAALPASENPTLHWRGALVGPDRRSTPFWASVQVRIKRRIVRAARSIPAGAVLTTEDLTDATEQSSVFESGPLPDLPSIVGKETLRSIATNQLIRLSWLRAPQLINKGQTVRVTVESGKAVLGFDARAMTSGSKGDTLVFLNEGVGKKFRAEVAGPGKAIVRMEIQSK